MAIDFIVLLISFWQSVPGFFLNPVPLLIEQFSQLLVIQLVETFAGEYHSVNWTQLLLALAESLAKYTLYSVTLYCQSNMFFGDDQAQPGRVFLIGSTEDKQVLVRSPNGRIIKNSFIVTGAEQSE